MTHSGTINTWSECVLVIQSQHIEQSTMDSHRRRRLILLQNLARIEMEIALDELALVEYLRMVNRRRRRQLRRAGRRHWVRPWISRRDTLGQYATLMRELRAEDPTCFINYMRLPPELYDEVLTRITPRITKKDTWWRNALEPGLKLAVTMRHLASGDSYSSLKWDFRIPNNTMSIFVREVCQAIVDEYAEEVITCPSTPDEWRAIADQFAKRWNFPHVCGAIDGKHVSVLPTVNLYTTTSKGTSLFF